MFSASSAALGDVNLSELKALIGLAGARVAAGIIAESLPEGFQRSEFLFDHGFIDRVITRSELRNELVALLRYLRPAAIAPKANGNGSGYGLNPLAHLEAFANRVEKARG